MSAFKRNLRNWRDEYAAAFNHILDDELTHQAARALRVENIDHI